MNYIIGKIIMVDIILIICLGIANHFLKKKKNSSEKKVVEKHKIIKETFDGMNFHKETKDKYINSECSNCEVMQELVQKKSIQDNVIHQLLDENKLELFAANCLPKDIGYWLDRGNHYTVNNLYHCTHCNRYFYVGFCLYGSPIIKEILESDAISRAEGLEWGNVGTFFDKGQNVNMDTVAEKVIKEVKKQLKKTELPGYSYYNSIIMKMFDGSHYDMQPGITTYTRSAKLSTYERGKCIYEYYTEDMRDVVYYILEHVIGLVIEGMIHDKYVHADGSLHFTDEIRQEKKEIKAGAFHKIGDVYEVWYQADRNQLNMEIL